MSFLRFLILATAVACAGPSIEVTARTPRIGTAPSSLDLGDVTVSLSTPATVFITNSGGADLTFTAAIEGDRQKGWHLPVSEATVKPRQSFELLVEVTPKTFVDLPASLILTSNDPDTPELAVPLMAHGAPGPVPNILVDPLALDFGDVTGKATDLVTVHNTGDADLHIHGATIAGSGRFTMRTQPEGATIAAQASLPIVIDYTPTGSAGDSATLHLTSDDPDEPDLDISLIGNGGSDDDWPVAVVSCPSTANPPTQITLDGSQSHDPSGHTPLTFFWQLASLPLDTQGHPLSSARLTSPGAAQTGLWLDAIGTYAVDLRVTNAIGLTSQPTRCTIEAIPAEDLLIQLTWDTEYADLDLHLARNGAAPFTPVDDVNYCNRRPVWDGAGSAANPYLNLDDKQGRGPENIAIPSPQNGSYEVFVHYFDDHGDDLVTATVRVWLGGVKKFEGSKQLKRNDLWDAAQISWPAKTVGGVAGAPVEATARTCP